MSFLCHSYLYLSLFIHKQTKQNKNTKMALTLKDNTFLNCLIICGGPCHLSSFRQCSGPLYSLENSLFVQLWEQ